MKIMNKQKLREIIFGYRTKAGKRFDVILLLAIIISVVAVMLDSDKEIHKQYGRLLLIAEWVFTLLFTIEYILRIYCSTDKKKYILSFMGIIDLLSIIPTYLIIFYAPIVALIDIRVLRLIRIFRIFKLSPYLRSGHTMQIALRSSRPKIIVFILSVSLVVIILGTLMYIIEGQQNGFDNIPKSIYWAVVTLTTVGYGDVVPLTTLGKTVAVFIMLLGYAIIAVPTGIVSSEMSKNRNDKEQLENQEEILEKEEEIIAKDNEILKKLEALEKKIDKLK
jgi:voltage-gated potassium channel